MMDDFFNDLHVVHVRGRRPSFIRSIDDLERLVALSLKLAGEPLDRGATMERTTTIAKKIKGNPEA
jgi:hypothetical protein